MSEAWPTPQEPIRDPLPRVEDLPVAEQGYEQESVKAAFDSFYRHAAQLDAALRTLEAVDSFHRHATALRGDLRALRAAGWTQQSWGPPPTSYGYGLRASREGIPPAVWRIAGEVAFLVAAAVAVGVASLSWWAILLAMAGAFAIVCLIEWLAGREQLTFAQPAGAAAPHPVVEAQRVDDTAEQESLGWTAFEEAQEPSDAMTIIGGVPRETEEPEPVVEAAAVGVEAEAEPEEAQAEREPEPEPEPELPPAAEAAEEASPDGRRRWWRRRKPEVQAEQELELPHHVRVLPPEEAAEEEPAEDTAEEPVAAEADEIAEAQEGRQPDEESAEAPVVEEPESEEALLVEEPARRRFRRR